MVNTNNQKGVAMAIGIGVVVIALILIAYIFSLKNDSSDDLMVGETQKVAEKNSESSSVVADNKGDAMMEEKDGDAMMEEKGSAYLDYTEESFAAASSKKRVYFFHASWCPTCKQANQDIVSGLDKLPSDVVVFKTDYDTEDALKKKYGITYQHTFVQVDENGDEIAKWNGGGVDEIIKNVK